MDYTAIADTAGEGRGTAEQVTTPTSERMQQVTSQAQGAMTKIQESATAAFGKVTPFLPDVSNVYLDPLLPGAEISLSDRFKLIMESAKPWKEFFNISEFNLPPLTQIKTRLGHNIETYFYNYVQITCIYLILFSFFHLLPVICLVVLIGLAYVLFVSYPEDIDVAGKFTIDDMKKKIIVGVVGVVLLFYGGILTLVISMATFIVILVLVHGLIRDDCTIEDGSA